MRAKFLDCVLESQLSALQSVDFHVVGGWVCESLVNLPLDVAMLALKFLKMGC